MDGAEELELRKVLESLVMAVADGGYESATRTIGERSVSNRNWLLGHAAGDGEKELVELLLDNGVDVNAGAGDKQVTPLARAAWYNYYRVVELLIHHGACVDTVDLVQSMTVLTRAAEDGYQETVQLLVDNGANVNASSSESGYTALQVAARWGYESIVNLLVEKGAIDTPAPKGGYTALQAAASLGHRKMVELLIKKADVNAKAAEGYGRTALQAAAEGGYVEVVELLIKEGADVNAKAAEDYGRTALQAAAEGGYVEVVKLLIKGKADVNAPAGKKHGKTALQAAANSGHREMVELLIKERANVNAKAVEDYGRTALQAAAEGGYVEVVELLIEEKANVNAPAGKKHGKTALQAAANSGHREMVELLIKERANVNAKAAEDYGRTALQAAAEGGYVEVVELLIKEKADVNAPAGKTDGKMALRAAVGGDGESVVAEDEEQEGEEVDGGAGNEEEQEGEKEKGEDEEGKKTMKNSEKKKESKRVKIVKLLLDKGALVHATKGEGGRNVMHTVCLRGGPEDLYLLDLLLEKSTTKDFNAKDSSGSTPLHIAVRQKNLRAVNSLLKERVDLEIEDTSGKTALQVAFRGWVKNIPKNFPANTPQPDPLKDILKVLLKNGSPIDGLELKDMPRLRDLGHASGSDSYIVMLHDDLTKGTNISGIPTEFPDLRDRFFRSPSICFRNPTLSPSNNRPFVHTSSFLQRYLDPHPNALGVKWAWSTITDESADESASFTQRIPDFQEIISIMPAEVILIGYVCFDCPMHLREGNQEVAPSQPPKFTNEKESNQEVAPSHPPQFTNEKVEISWVMKQEKDASFLRSVHYRGSMNLQYLAIPRSAVHFATLFLGDIHERWKKVIGSAKAHLVSRRDSQLKLKGKNRETINFLLEDSKEWSGLRKTWKSNRELAKKLLDQLRESDILFPEVENPWQFRKEHESTIEGPKGKDVTKRGPEEQKAGETEADDPSKEQSKTVPTPDPNVAGSIKGATGPLIVEEQKAGETEADDPSKEQLKTVPTPDPNVAGSVKGATGPLIVEQQKSGETEAGDPSKEQPDPNAAGSVKGATDSRILEQQKAGQSETGKGDKPKNQKPGIQPTAAKPSRDQKVEKPKENELKILTINQAAKLLPMKKLLETFDALVKECEEGIAELEKDTTDMIQLEFNLISIYEARRSIETSVSMKRLSWITFIFLPLMFITGVFGMNVNLFQNEPPRWQWYFVVVVPFSFLVLSVWTLCKYLPGVGKLEKRLDEFLKKVFDSPPRGESKESTTQHDSNIRSSHNKSKPGTVVETSKATRPPRKTLGSGLIHWRGKKGADEENGSGMDQ